MPRLKGVEGQPDGACGRGRGQLEEQGRDPLSSAGVHPDQEAQPFLPEGEREIAVAGDRPDRAVGRGGGQQLGLRLERGRTEQPAQLDLAAGDGAQPGGEPGEHQRGAAELEEIVVHADPLGAQQLGPDPGDGVLRGGARGEVAGPPGGGGQVRSGQRRTVGLAARGERERLERHEDGGHQRLRDPGAQELAQARRGLPGAGGEVRDEQPAALRGAGSADRRAGHLGVRDQGGLDLARLDPDTVDLDLVVDPAAVLQGGVGAPADQVAGPVEPGAGRAVGVGHEALGGQVRAAEVAAGHPDAAGVQLSWHADRGRAALLVQDQHPQSVDRVADRHRADGLAWVVRLRGDVDRALGGPVGVPDLHVRAAEPVDGTSAQFRVQRLAGREEQPQRAEFGPAGLLDEQPQHRGDDLKHGDLLLGGDAHELGRVALGAGRGRHHGAAAHQRGEQLPAGGVKADRGLLQDRVLRAEPVPAYRPEHPVGDALMADQHALGTAGGAGGVDRVGGVLRVGGGLRRGVRVPVEPDLVDQHGRDRAARPARAASVSTSGVPVSARIQALRSRGCPGSSGT